MVHQTNASKRPLERYVRRFRRTNTPRGVDRVAVAFSETFVRTFLPLRRGGKKLRKYGLSIHLSHAHSSCTAATWQALAMWRPGGSVKTLSTAAPIRSLTTAQTVGKLEPSWRSGIRWFARSTRGGRLTPEQQHQIIGHNDNTRATVTTVSHLG